MRLVWSGGDGEILKHPYEAVRRVTSVIFEQFTGLRLNVRRLIAPAKGGLKLLCGGTGT